MILNPLSGQTSQDEALIPNTEQLANLHSDSWLIEMLKPTTVPAKKIQTPNTIESTTIKITLVPSFIFHRLEDLV
jgi:hypothetical protein